MRMMVFYADTHHVGFMLQFQQTLYCVPMLTGSVFQYTGTLYVHITPAWTYAHAYLYVAVPGRNRTLFRCVFRSHYCVRSALAWNFC